jgi:DnaJ-class molecular chaperone
MIQPRTHSHYDTLGVERGASAEQVRGAYRRLAQTFHPDKHPGRPAAAAVMAQINEAYEVLSDPAQRGAYDAGLAHETARAAAAASVGFTPDRFGWGGWLVFATTSFAVLTVGYVLIATWTSAATAARATAATASQQSSTAPPRPAPSEQPAPAAPSPGHP